MHTITVNLAFRDDILRKIDREADAESRSRSELIREASRQYLERKKRWQAIFALGGRWSRQNNLKPTDIEKEIKAWRKSR